jgi:chorismate mutase
MNIIAVRGAVALEELIDESSQMMIALGDLLDALATSNNFEVNQIISIQFTQTNDLRKMNAAAALRSSRPEYSSVPLFCSLEPDIENSLPRTVRVLVTYRGKSPGKPVYSGAAAALRPDLSSGNDS